MNCFIREARAEMLTMHPNGPTLRFYSKCIQLQGIVNMQYIFLIRTLKSIE